MSLAACGETIPDHPLEDGIEVKEVFVTDALGGCIEASPTVIPNGTGEAVVAIWNRGTVAALNPETGDVLWQTTLPVPADPTTMLALPTPVIVQDRHLVVGWTWFGVKQFLGVIDITTGELNTSEFEILEFAGSVRNYDDTQDVTYRPDKQFLRGGLLHIETPDRDLGLLYAALGNAPNSSPHHGWIFEIDLDAWRASGASAAIVSTFSTTALNECGPEGSPDAGLCGGGIWNARGLQMYGTPADYTLFAATGNGLMDLSVNAYANSVLRLGRGLDFQPGCDAGLCAGFDPVRPSVDCLESCENLFMPRLEDGEPALAPPGGYCDGLGLPECYARIDADLGSSAPLRLELASGATVFVQAGKDGAMYLIDGDRMGVMHQRLQLVPFCGTETDPCDAEWLGMFMTHPVSVEVDGIPHVVLASTMADRSNPSGITAVRILEGAMGPRMEVAWRVPDFDGPVAPVVFRHQTGRPIVVTLDEEPYVFVVETRRSRSGGVGKPPGQLWGVRVRDGALMVHHALDDAGARFNLPLLRDDTLYLSSCDAANTGNGRIQALRLSTE